MTPPPTPPGDLPPPPPTATVAPRPAPAPSMPALPGSGLPVYATHGSNDPRLARQIADAEAEYAQTVRRRARRRRKIYAVLLALLIGVAAGGWFGFKELIYGEAPAPVQPER